MTKTDDAAADFGQGTQGNTVVRADGAVELARTLEEPFGPGETIGWTSTVWPLTDPPVVRAPTVVDGSLKVDGERADSGATVGPGSSLEFTATLGTDNNQHVGFATDFDVQPWAIFSTGNDGTFVARVSDGTTKVDYPMPAGVDVTGPHTYRINWTATGFEFFVDGVPIPALSPAQPPVATAMRVQASDLVNGGGVVSVDSMILNTHKTPGMFTSRTFDAGDARVAGLSFTPTSAAPTGTAIAYETRTADTAAGLDAATWSAVSAGGAVASAPKQFLQYRAAITATDTALTPKLDKVEVGFTIDDQKPAVTIDGVAVSGSTANVTFSRDDDAAVVACSLDGGPFAGCASPAEFRSLAVGAHTIAVRATDAHGNVGSATRAFDVAQPPPSGGAGTAPPPSGGTKPPTGAAPDRTAPKVLVTGRSLRVSSSGVAKLAVRCPRSEASCAVTVKLTLAGKSVARKTLTLSSGSTRSFRLKLSKAARRALAARSKLAATAVVTAADAAGNRKTTTRGMTLRGSAG